MIWCLVFLSALLIWGTSFVGPLLAQADWMGSKTAPRALALAAGLMLGESLLHAAGEIDSMVHGYRYVLLGALTMVAIRSFALRRHGHKGSCHHAYAASFVPAMLVANAMHTALDGLLIAGAYLVDVRTGLATTVAIAVHELPRETGDYAALIATGTQRSRATFWNAISAIPVVLGAVCGLLLSGVGKSSIPLGLFSIGSFSVMGGYLILAAYRMQSNVRHRLIAWIVIGAALSAVCELCGIL